MHHCKVFNPRDSLVVQLQNKFMITKYSHTSMYTMTFISDHVKAVPSMRKLKNHRIGWLEILKNPGIE